MPTSDGTRRQPPRLRPGALAGVALALLVGPFALAGEDDGSRRAVTAGDARGEPVQIQLRNRSRGETGLVANSDGYSLRLSNVNRGDGGGAVFGCRAAPGRESCVNADNLANGLAFFFRTRSGGPAGRIEVGDPSAAPFTTNAGGVATGLNADKVDGLDAAQLQGQQGPQGPQGAQGPQGSPGLSTGAAGGDLTGDYPNPAIASSAVTGAKVQDRSLRLADIATDHGFFTENADPIAANTCRGFDSPLASNALVGDLTLVVPRDNLDHRFTAEGLRVTIDGTLKWRLCNRTEGAVNPPTFQLHWMVLRP